jgi:hypothetical protein
MQSISTASQTTLEAAPTPKVGLLSVAMSEINPNRCACPMEVAEGYTFSKPCDLGDAAVNFEKTACQ